VILAHQDGFHDFHLRADALCVRRVVMSVYLIEIVVVENCCVCHFPFNDGAIGLGPSAYHRHDYRKMGGLYSASANYLFQ
jgi:hypothetical protein